MGERAIIVHTLAHARAAIAAAEALGVPVQLWSPPGAAAYLGVGFFHAMIDEARKEHPAAKATAIIDCADHAGHAQAAIRQGIDAICFRGKKEASIRIADIARKSRTGFLSKMPSALDLLDKDDPATACRDWLAR